MTLPVIDLSRLRIEGVSCELTGREDDPYVWLRVCLRIYHVTTGKRETVASQRSVGVRGSAGISTDSIREAIADTIMHEITECMTIDGKRIEDPHPHSTATTYDEFIRGRAPNEWEAPPPLCDCPKSKDAVVELAEKDPELSNLHVCQLAFARIGESMGLHDVPAPHGRIIIPVVDRDPTFTPRGPVERYRAIDITDFKVHG
jgi:hypothetical protein